MKSIVAFAFVAACASFAFGQSHFAAQSVYLHEPIQKYHRVSITGTLGGDGVLILNPNACQLNEFGDPTVCTLIAETEVAIKITDTKKPDPENLGRMLYELEGADLGNPLYLVVWPDPQWPARLVYNDRGPNAPRPITLEPLVYTASAGRGELCMAQYNAIQAGGEVVLFATGVHPTAGYQVSFRKLAITVFPPEFRLEHVAPSGPTAQVITPFSESTRFPATEPVERVVVHDAKGRHEVPVAADEGRDSKNSATLIATINADRQLSEFAGLLQLTDLSEVLDLHGPFTIFAPTNEAIFNDLSRTEYRELHDPSNKALRIRFLCNHIMSNGHTVEDIERAKSIHTWTGQVFVHPGKGLSTDTSKIVPYVSKDGMAGNGVLHIMGGILRPQPK